MHAPKTTPRFFALLAAATMLSTPAWGATTLYWDPGLTATTTGAGGGGGAWDTTTSNWSSTPAGTAGTDVVWSSSDVAAFGGMAGSVTMGSAMTADGLRFDVATGGYTLDNSVSVGASGITDTATSGTTTIGGTLTSNANNTITTGGALLSVSGFNAGGVTTTINGNVTTTGNAGLQGSGTVIVNSGKLAVGSTSYADHFSGTVTVNSGATFAYDKTDGSYAGFGNATVQVNGGTFDYAAPSTGNLIITSSSTGTANFTKTGTLSVGTLSIGSGVTANFAGMVSSGTVTLAGGTFGASVNNAGAANLNLTASSVIGGPDSGTYLELNGGAVSGTGDLTVNGYVWLGGAGTAFNNAGNLIIASGALDLYGKQTFGANVTGVVINGGRLGAVSGALASLSGTGGTLGLDGDSTTTTINQTSAGTFAGNITGGGDIVIQGGNTLTLSSANSNFTGDITVNAATLVATGGYTGTTSNLGALNTTGRTITVNTGGALVIDGTNQFGSGGQTLANIPTLVVNGGVVTADKYNVIGDVTLNAGTLASTGGSGGSYQSYEFNGSTVTVGGTGASTISGSGANSGMHLAGGATTTFDVGATGASGADLVVSATLIDGSFDRPGAGALAKTGAGTMLLAAANTYTGATTISAGTLMTGDTAALGGTTSVTVSGGVLRIGDGTVKTVALAAGASLAITGGLGGGTLKLDAALGTATPAIVLSGNGGYTFDGTLDLSHVFDASGAGSYTLISVDGTGTKTDTLINIVGYSGSLAASFANGELVLTAVPEPSAYGLLGAGVLAGIVSIRRRKKPAVK